MPRILLVEDDHKFADVVREFLLEKGFSVEHEADGRRAALRISEERPDLVILDLLLPGLDGLDVCRKVRPVYAGPILMLTALGDEVDEVVGLEIGADDYLVKPVRPRLLLARIHALLRRGRTPPAGEIAGDPPLVLGGLRIDPSSRETSLNGRTIELTTAEFDLLICLARRAGRVVTRREICRELRGIEYDGLDRTIDLRVTRLRKKLGDRGKSPDLIKAVRGEGYLMAVRR